ncbi:MAG: FliM/FliN family flagellar motor switch protein [Acidobacteria bacterium]|nr:FliM/FliN family flagellar motor switch protein [Acidobacteriota bacterium]
MATTQQSMGSGSESFAGAAPPGVGAKGLPADVSTVPTYAEPSGPTKREEKYALLKGIPIEVDVSIPVRRFQVRSVLALAVGQVIASRWLEGEDVPLAAHGAQLAWSEVEVIDQKLAVRITRLA